MKLTIFGATGGIGGQLLEQAVAAGHQVTVVVRDAGRLAPSRKGLRVVTADLMDPAPGVLESAVAGADAVLSGVGPRPMAKAGVAEQGTRAIVRAMDATGSRRLVVVSAAPISTVPSPGRRYPPSRDPGEGFLMRHLLTPFAHTVMRERYADLALMEDVLRASNLEWTIFRPPRLTNGPLTGAYRTAVGRNLRRGLVVSRADVAHAMLAAVTQPATRRQEVGIAR
ncbi:MAG: NAD(P)-dependent oxidoreductase [Gemmatimonadales bacterium]